MSFTPKTWHDRPNRTTPLNAEALQDLEQRISGYGDDQLGGHESDTGAHASLFAGRQIVPGFSSLLRVSDSDYRAFQNDAMDGIFLRGVNMPQDATTPAESTSLTFNNTATLADFQTVRANGANLIRWGFNYASWNLARSTLYDMLDNAVQWAHQCGIWLILCNFTLPGPQGVGDPHPGAFDYYEGYQSGHAGDFYTNATKQAAIQAMWVDLATRYADEPAIAGWDLLNEPTPASGTETNNLYAFWQTLVNAIRAVDDHLIFIEAVSGSTRFPGMTSGSWLTGENIVLEIHQYHPFGYCESGSAQTWPYNDGTSTWSAQRFVDDFTSGIYTDYLNAHNFAIAHGLPIYLGEFGAPAHNGDTNNAAYVTDFTTGYDSLGFHWTQHTYRGDGNTSAWYPSFSPGTFASPHQPLIDALGDAYGTGVQQHVDDRPPAVGSLGIAVQSTTYPSRPRSFQVVEYVGADDPTNPANVESRGVVPRDGDLWLETPTDTVLSDLFTGTAATDLTAHTSDSGASWSEPATYAAGAIVISDANRIRGGSTTGPGNVCLASVVPSGNQYDIVINWHCFTSFHAGFFFCSTADATSTMDFRWSSSLNQWLLEKTGGTLKTVSGQAPQAGQDQQLVVKVRTGGVTVEKDGLVLLSSSDTSLLANKHFGPSLAGNQGNAAGIHISDVTVTEPGSISRHLLVEGVWTP